MHVGTYERLCAAEQSAVNVIVIEDVKVVRTCDTDQIVLWDLFATPSVFFRTGKVGQCALFRQHTKSLSVWVAANLWLIEPVRGRGLMRRLLTLLRPRYPNLCSSFAGETSEDAIKMWVALGAEKLFTTRCPKGYVYLLR